MEIEQKYTKLTRDIKDSYDAIDGVKLSIARDLLELEEMFESETVKEFEYASFRGFLMGELGRNYSRILPLLRIAKYIKKYNVQYGELLDIPISNIELIAKRDIKWSNTVMENIRNLPYNVIKELYENTKSTS